MKQKDFMALVIKDDMWVSCPICQFWGCENRVKGKDKEWYGCTECGIRFKVQYKNRLR